MTTQDSLIDLGELLSDAKRRSDENAWREICPCLSLARDSSERRHKIMPIDDKDFTRKREKLVSHGYSLFGEQLEKDLVTSLREGIESLHKKGIPASFAFLFDEAWLLATQAKDVLQKATHEKNVFNFDLLAWYIPLGQGGFSPHRDRQPEDAPSSFHDDDQAKFVTQWIALSDATPENSCLYVIPKPYDSGYTEGDTEESGDPLRRALSTKQSYQHIRALPRKAGQSVLFTHRIIHWGSQGDVDASVAPRIAISFVCSDPDYEAPLLVNHEQYFQTVDDDGLRLPPFQIRLLLVCAQLLIYYQRFELDKAVIKACYDYCKLHQDELEESYRKKVFLEFVKAMKEHQNEIEETTAPARTQQSDINGGLQDDGNDDDDEDAIMEEMLNAEEGGYGEFEDDFDDLEDRLHREEAEKIDREDQQEEDEAEEEDVKNVDLFGKRTQSDSIDETQVKKQKTST